MSEVTYNDLLYRISKRIDKINALEHVLYVCRGKLPHGASDTIRDTRSLFEKLEESNYLGVGSLRVLKDVLKALKEWDLHEKVENFERLRGEYEKLRETVIRVLEELNDMERLKSAVGKRKIPKESKKDVRSLVNFLGTDSLDLFRGIFTELNNDELRTALEKYQNRRTQYEACEKEEVQREAICAFVKAFGGRIKAAIQVHCNWQNACGTLFVIGIGRMLWNWPSATDFFENFNREILPAAARLITLSEGSVCFTVKAETSLALEELYERYSTGRLQRDLQEFLVTDDIRQLADGEEVIISVHVDEKEFKEALNDLEKVDKEEMLFCEQEEGNGATDIQRPVEQVIFFFFLFLQNDTVPDSGQTTISVDVAASQGATKIKGSDEEPGQATTSVDPSASQDETYIKKSVQETSASGPAIPPNSLPHHFEKGTPWALADRNFMKFPPLTSSFIGRENVVKEIVSKFTRKADPLRMAVILSIPGAGKTQTAIKVGHDLLNCNRSVIFIDKQESLRQLCDEIIYEICGQYISESQDLVCRAKKRLKALESDVVIILDNTEDVQGKEGMEFDNFVKYVVEKAPSIQLIITTQKDIGFTSLNVHKERLEPLDSHSCALLLRESVDITEKNAQEIGKLCRGIPLFLVNCVALLQTSFSVDALIRLLKENPIELLENSAQNVYDALGLFLRNMSNPLLKHLVQVSVFPSSFSAKHFRQVLFDDNELKSESVRSQMVGLSLLQRMRDEKYALHPLVREYCRARREILKMVEVGKSAQGKFNAYFIEKLRTLSKDFITRNSAMVAISSFREDKANIMEALRNHLDDKSSAEEKAFGVDVAISTEVLDFLSKVLSPPAECLKFYQICYGIAKDSGDQRRLADSLTAMGFCYLCDAAHLRHNPQSLDNLERAKEIYEKLSKEQQNCQAHALIQCKLGLCLCLQGQEKDKGLNLIREGIELKKKLRDPLYLAAGHCDLGNAYCILDDHQKAIDIWEKETFPIYQKQLGEHPWTATILHFIAVSYTAQAQRNVDGAVKKSRDALKMRKKLLGFHQETARSHVLLSDALELQNDFKSALKELEEALKIQKEVLGENHNSTKDTQGKMRRIMIAIMQESN
ncbi:uncharacterized protein LOC141879355 isoform X3 [Acropora palmata]|uniref:uncharacterized protein LOC141879355 isoform X3 n=1 Tax=Acropora palmata TaxID=6131 RepID=UPI003DA1068C